MTDLLKRDWPYLLLAIFLIVVATLRAAMFRYGFFTAYDEAYFLLKLKEAYAMTDITGKSQWNLIAVKWFPYLDLTSKVNAYIASSLLTGISVLVSTITCYIINGKHQFLKCLSLSLLIFSPLFGAQLNYVSMQASVLCWALCAFVLFYYSQKEWRKRTFAVICGTQIGIALFVIIPAAIATAFAVALLVVVMYSSEVKKLFIYLSCFLGGGIIAISYIHLFVCPISDIVQAMLFTASYIGKSGYSYDGSSFIIQYGLFFRDFLFVLALFAGAYCISRFVGNRLIGGIIYIILIAIFAKYQVKPRASSYMFFASVFVLPFLFEAKSCLSLKRTCKNETWVSLFLVVFPFIASLGTNTSLSGRIGCFLIPWLILWIIVDKHINQNQWRYVRTGVILLMLIPLTSTFKQYRQRDDSFHFTRGNEYFSQLAITEKQKQYFDKVYDILQNYQYKPEESVIFTSVFDYCCLYAFDAVNSSNFHQPQNFHFFPKEKMVRPDYIFICPWDSIVLGNELKGMPWGWPEEFDRYYVGSPEPDDAPWVNNLELEQRSLYCRKTLKILADE